MRVQQLRFEHKGVNYAVAIRPRPGVRFSLRPVVVGSSARAATSSREMLLALRAFKRWWRTLDPACQR